MVYSVLLETSPFMRLHNKELCFKEKGKDCFIPVLLYSLNTNKLSMQNYGSLLACKPGFALSLKENGVYKLIETKDHEILEQTV